MASSGSLALHTINPVEIDINGSKAFSVSTGNISARFTRGESDYDLVSSCRFLSRLQTLDGPGKPVWKILTMEVIYIHDAIVPVVPQIGPSTFDTTNMDRSTRKSYRFLSSLLAERGHKVSNDLPGVDDEQSVKDLMDRNHEWMNK
jgi:hypothetical protein